MKPPFTENHRLANAVREHCRQMLLDITGNNYTWLKLPEVAKYFKLTTSQFAKRLRKADTTFRQLLDEERIKRFIALDTAGIYTQEQIAVFLGYSDRQSLRALRERHQDLLRTKEPVVYGTPITLEEAQSIIDNENGIVHGGAYTYHPEKYSAAGTYPGNLRGGPKPNLSKRPVDQWYKLTLKDVICIHGFYPCAFMLGAAIRYQGDQRDYSVDFDELIKYCINSRYTKEDLINDARFGPSKIWPAYFDAIYKQGK